MSKNGKKTGQKPVVMEMAPVRLEDDETVNRDEQLAASAPSEEGEQFTVRHLYPNIVGQTWVDMIYLYRNILSAYKQLLVMEHFVL